MRFKAAVPIKLKTPSGIIALNPGDTFKPKSLEAVRPLVMKGILVPVDGEFDTTPDDGHLRKPYVDRTGTLVIPFDSPAQYRWWAGGQSIADTLAELEVSEELWEQYTGTRYPKEVN